MLKYVCITVLLSLIAGAVNAESIYPAKGQSPQQQKTDEAECYIWAVGDSGYDPANPPAAQTASQPDGPSGARLRGAARGALIGEIADGDTGDAALVGAVMGGSRERRSRRRATQEVQAASGETQQVELTKYNNARAACLEGRGYSVK